jgi:hypothetical protein
MIEKNEHCFVNESLVLKSIRLGDGLILGF